MSANVKEIDLNVGGLLFSVDLNILKKFEHSKLARMFTSEEHMIEKDKNGRLFIDRDGITFKKIVDYLKNDDIEIPNGTYEKEKLFYESTFYEIDPLVKIIKNAIVLKNDDELKMTKQQNSGYVILAYKGTIETGKDLLSEWKFRRISRIYVCGRVSLIRSIFGYSLNESRDFDFGNDDRYTSRFYLNHNVLEDAFDTLASCGFEMVGSSQYSSKREVHRQRFESENDKDTKDNGRFAFINEYTFLKS